MATWWCQSSAVSPLHLPGSCWASSDPELGRRLCSRCGSCWRTTGRVHVCSIMGDEEQSCLRDACSFNELLFERSLSGRGPLTPRRCSELITHASAPRPLLQSLSPVSFFPVLLLCCRGDFTRVQGCAPPRPSHCTASSHRHWRLTPGLRAPQRLGSDVWIQELGLWCRGCSSSQPSACLHLWDRARSRSTLYSGAGT